MADLAILGRFGCVDTAIFVLARDSMAFLLVSVGDSLNSARYSLTAWLTSESPTADMACLTDTWPCLRSFRIVLRRICFTYRPGGRPTDVLNRCRNLDGDRPNLLAKSSIVISVPSAFLILRRVTTIRLSMMAPEITGFSKAPVRLG